MSGHISLVAANMAVTEELETNEDGLPRTKTFDAVVFDVLRVSADDIATQLTLIDLPLFQAIVPEELSTCNWTTKRKFEITPNIVRFTRRFNHVSFWITREILNANTARFRAELIVHFIKVAKKLLELNNLNSLKAIVSGLHSAPIYRLNKTWMLVPKKDKERLDRLNELVSEDENRYQLRVYLETVKLPCIPYLGMYLTDLTYINTIHPCTGGMDTERTLKMNEIFRVISDFQQSNYDHLHEVPHVQKYLKSVKYIEELQKFVEDDNYKLSLKIEPTVAKSCSLKDTNYHKLKTNSRSRESLNVNEDENGDVRRHTTQVNMSNLLQLPGQGYGSLGRSFVPGHRKTRSLGSNIVMSTSLGHGSQSSSLSSTGSRHLLDDSLIEEKLNEKFHELHASTSYDSGLDHDEPETHPIIQSLLPTTPRRRASRAGGIRKSRRVSVENDFECNSGDELTPHVPHAYFKLQGFLKRKCYLKNGNKPKVPSWQRFWVGLTGSCLVYFLPRHRAFGGHERSHFRVDPHKVVSLYGWAVVQCCGMGTADLFQLTDDTGGNVYRFHAGTKSNASLWSKYLEDAIRGGEKGGKPQNLITFDDHEEEDTRL